MEAERSFSESQLPEIGTTPAESFGTNDKQPMEWYEWFLNTHEQLLDKHIATTLLRCRVLVLSGTDLQDTYETDGEMNTVMSDEELGTEDVYQGDKNKAELLQDSLKESKLTFKVINMSKYFHDFETMDEQDITKCKERMLEDIQNAMPTLIVLPFQAVRFSECDKKSAIYSCLHI